MFDFVDTFSKIQVDQIYDENKFDWQNGKVTILEYKDKVGNEPKIIEKTKETAKIAELNPSDNPIAVIREVTVAE